MTEIFGFEETSGFGTDSVQVSDMREADVYRKSTQRSTAITNELHPSTMFCNAGCMILHARTPAYISKDQDLNIDVARRMGFRSLSRGTTRHRTMAFRFTQVLRRKTEQDDSEDG